MMTDTAPIATPEVAHPAAKAARPSLFGATARASRVALQWRLLALWLVVLLVPTIIAALPMWQLLSANLDHSVYAGQLAQRLDLVALADLGSIQSRTGDAFGNGSLVAVVLTLLLSPLLSGMTISAARAPQQLGFTGLAAGGMQEYGRMLRMLLLAVVPLGIAGALGGIAMSSADDYAKAATLAGDADRVKMLAVLALGVLMLVAGATLDAGRAMLAIDRRRKSAVVAWWHGCKLLVRRPFATLGIYVGIGAFGLALAGLLGVARINVPALGVGGFIAALALTQLAVAVVAWMRSARLAAMMELARIHQQR